MITIFHLSDLHIDPKADNHQWERMKKELLDIAREQSNEQQRILIVTGDFHNYADADYQKAYDFLIELTDALELERKEDLFVIPGNHDVGSEAAMKPFFLDDWEDRREAATEWLKTHNSADKFYPKRVETRLESYVPYCAFARDLGVYPKDSEVYLPARVHVRCWNGRLNILHLNTTLIADGDAKRSERLDIRTATSAKIWTDMDAALPALALGHNSFYDLDEQQQNALKRPFREWGVCAYLCGDTHAEETDPNRQLIRIDYGYTSKPDTIPNVVGVKGAADENDKFSDFGLYLHEWNERTGEVTLRHLRWQPDKTQAGFLPGDVGDYTMPHCNSNDILPDRNAPRAERDAKDETREAEQARVLLSAGEEDKALAVLRKEDGGVFAKTLRWLLGKLPPTQPLTILRPSESGGMEDAEQARKRRVRGYIDKKLLQIDILKSKGLNRETIPEIRACYEECVALAKAHRVGVYVLYDYAAFLYNLNDYPPAIEAARWLLDYERQERAPEENQAALKNLLGVLLSDTNRMAEAEEQFREALRLYRRLAETNPAAYEPDVAMTCNNLAGLYLSTNRMDKAEEHIREALGSFRRLAETNPAAYEPNVATTCFNYGLLLLEDASRIAEVKPLFEEAARLWDKYPHHSGDAQDAHNVLNILFP